MRSDLVAAVDRFAGLRVAVIGDAMLDTYHDGRAGRLCREAPVPIVSMHDRHDAPGGAANAAANACHLGARVRLLGLVGSDDAGRALRAALDEPGVDHRFLLEESDRATLHKERIIADGQLLVRADSGSTEPPSADVDDLLVEAVRQLDGWADVVIVSDYAYGAVTDRVLEALADLRTRTRPILIADAKDARRLASLRPDAVKPNFSEACALLGITDQLDGRSRAEVMLSHADALLAITGADNVVVTLDGDGSLLLRPSTRAYRTYARPQPMDHAAGAGDTVAAVLGLSLASGLPAEAAVELAAAAAAVAVSKPRTATCSAEELRISLAGSKRPRSVSELRRRLDLERSQGRRVVFTNGCFDILHSGHVAYLNRAKALGDVLVVAVNSDASVRRLKGSGRPVNSLDDRMDVLAGLGCIDFLVAFEEDSPAELLRQLRPDIVTKGGDYSEETLPEAELVRSLGGEVRIVPFVDDRSTTGIIERIGAGAALSASGPAARSP